jgi:hypothetical protein
LVGVAALTRGLWVAVFFFTFTIGQAEHAISVAVAFGDFLLFSVDNMGWDGRS